MDNQIKVAAKKFSLAPNLARGLQIMLAKDKVSFLAIPLAKNGKGFADIVSGWLECAFYQ